MPHRGIFLYGRLQISSILNRPKRTPVGCHTFILSLLLPEVLCADLNFPPRLLRPVHSYASINAPPLKMPHRGIFFFTVGFKSLRILSRPKKTPRRVSHFHLITTSARSALCGFKLSASLVASCAQLCLHKRSSLKNAPQGHFLYGRLQIPSVLSRPKKHP